MPKRDTTFKKGTSGNPKGGNMPMGYPSKQLQRLRWLANNLDTPTEDQALKHLQDDWKKKTLQYENLWAKLEKEFTDLKAEKAKSIATAQVVEGKPDEGTERIEELIESILAKAEQETGNA